MSEPNTFQAIRRLRDLRYVLLACTLMSAFAMPQWGFAFDSNGDGRIIVAQNDPKDKGKQKQQPKGPTPGGQQGQQGGPQQLPKQGTQQPIQKGPSGVQPGVRPGQQPGPDQQKQFGRQPPPGNQQFQQGGTQPGGQPGGAGQQPGPGQQKQFSRQPPPGGQQQFQQGGTQPGGQQPGVRPGQQPGPDQQRQFGRQPPTGTQPGGQPGQQQQFGRQPPAGTQPGVQPGTGQQQQFGRQPAPGTQPGGQPGQQQFGRQTPSGGQAGLSPQGGNIDQLRQQRQTRTDPSGKTTVIQEGNRTIVKDGNRTIIRADENERFRRFAGGSGRVEQRGNETYNIVRRPGGGDIINVTDRDGNFVRRSRVGPDGREVVLIDNRRRGPGFGTGLAIGLAAGIVGTAVVLNLPPPVVNIPRERYIVDLEGAPPGLLYETLDAPPLMAIERPYTLDEIRYNVELRDRMRRVDINTINFDFGSWTVNPDQYDRLAGIAEAMQRVLRRRPDEVFLIEGHTDAVGSDEDNLSLSDRRAEAVAIILSETFGIPPENLVTQGYGEQYLKVQTLEANRLNRRVAVRPVGALLAGGYQGRN